jgi:hypothetical protein
MAIVNRTGKGMPMSAATLRDRLQTFTTWPRLALAIWFLIGTVAVGRAALYSFPRHRGCYWLYAETGRNWVAGTSVYSPLPGLTVFRYSPLVAVFMVPFSELPDPLGSALLRLVNLGVYVGGLLWWARAGTPIPLSCTQRALLYLLAVPLSVSSLVDIQTNALTIGFLLLGVTAVARERWNWGAACVALACCVKAYPLAIALLLFAVHPRRFGGPFAVAAAVCLALPFAFQHPAYVAEQYGNWVRWGLNDRQAVAVEAASRDLRLLLRVWLVPLTPHVYRSLQVITGVGIAWLCVAERRAGLPPRRLLATLFGLGCCWMMVLGPATESTTYIMLAPALGWVTLEAWLEPRHPSYRAMVTSSFVLFTLTQLVLWFPHGRDLHRFAPHPIAGLLLIAALGVTEIQRLTRRVAPHRDSQKALALASGVRSWGEGGSPKPEARMTKEARSPNDEIRRGQPRGFELRA